ncbi:hypothetical protein GLOIN_2v1880492 [Rhizophagus clarus]|uniref:Uncharacterized protein n=1 Tax=Rhizophagus clarus TaxID=94130 RepID=A0A8H3QNK2_9GLOM|nr:hypothetical protein GLOIN_2v1880492 [Rhizophagus clarus]
MHAKKSPKLQRIKPNDPINAYKLMFKKHPIDSCIDSSLDIGNDDDDIEGYSKNLKNGFNVENSNFSSEYELNE